MEMMEKVKNEEMVVHWSGKVCRVLDVTVMDLMDKKQEYYVLQPVREDKERIYVPTVKVKEALRPLISRENALKLIEELPEIPAMKIKDERTREKEYKIAFYSGNYRDMVMMVKELYQRRSARAKTGKKPISRDQTQMSFVETAFEEEMAFALGIDKATVKEFIAEKLNTEEVVE